MVYILKQKIMNYDDTTTCTDNDLNLNLQTADKGRRIEVRFVFVRFLLVTVVLLYRVLFELFLFIVCT